MTADGFAGALGSGAEEYAPTDDREARCTCTACESPQWGAPGIAHCAACCGGSMIAEYSNSCPVAEHREWAERQFPTGDREAQDVEALATVIFADKLFEWLADFKVDNAGEKARLIAGSFVRDGWVAPTDLAARGRAAAEKALRDAADEMEAVIADGDVAEVAAHVEGEVNRGLVVDRRDALYEEPHTWLREWADRIARGGEST